MSPRGLMRAILLVVMVASLAACAPGYVDPPPDPPPDPTPRGGVSPIPEPPEIGVAYAMTFYCSVDTSMGGAYWRFEDPTNWPPEILVTVNGQTWISSPHAVPGIVTFTSPTTAEFRADVDGSVLRLAQIDNPVEAGCL